MLRLKICQVLLLPITVSSFRSLSPSLSLSLPLSLPLFSTDEKMSHTTAFVPETTWEPKAAELIVERWLMASSTLATGSCSPFLVALVGIPGSGKSTSAHLLAKALTAKASSPFIMPHDGYHYPLADLTKFPNPNDVIYRRGAPDTFDTTALLQDLKRLKSDKETTIQLPGFDHAKGDPEYNAHTFERTQHNIVICEGLYLLHDGDGWQEIQNLFDFSIFIDSNIDDCIERLKVRNTVIPGYTTEELILRCDAVDRVNAMTVQKSRPRADLHVSSQLYTSTSTHSKTL